MASLPHWSVQITVPPTEEPVSLAEAKEHLRIDGDYDNRKVWRLLSSARELCEAHTGRALMRTSYVMALDRFPLLPNSQFAPGNPSVQIPVVNNVWPLDPSAWAIMLPRAPLISVDSIDYFDPNGDPQTMDLTTVTVDGVTEPPRVAPQLGEYWPSSQFRPNSVSVNFTAGYASAQQVPSSICQAILLLAGMMYDDPSAAMKSSDLPTPIANLLHFNRVQGIW